MEIRKKLEDEIRQLEKELRLILPQEIKRARELGDLRENAEYQAAKDRQAYLEARLAKLRQRLSALSLINLEKIPRDRVSYGSTVVLFDPQADREITYKLVSSEEADAGSGLISTTSPIGRSLMGKTEGDEVRVVTPGGVKEYEIKKLITIHDSLEP